ncbi:right-handed parallel beta-helix repeat-containing protein [Ottowia thiooxydans]|uniref:right-handed parallel beta-helix repeat-containing protein n=1 Tax=Ottowia thiooxydans TaxID=219182 RepID=UPI0003FC84F2|nr:right-handed parallel beta-helix repeat-containing protein [Ottowia thiooxydans]
MRANFLAFFRLSIGLLCLFGFSQAALAQANRTWVSGVGDDVNPCSRTAPCKTFAGAISKTGTGGEISVLDPGGFGAVTITKSITIDGGGQVASINAPAQNAIIVNIGTAGGTVILRNIQLNGSGSGASINGLSGVKILAAEKVHLDNVRIQGFATGIELEPAAAGPTINVMVDNSRIMNNTVGIKTNTAKAVLRISDSTVTQNATGLAATLGASIISYNNNRLLGNTTDGAPTLTVYPR